MKWNAIGRVPAPVILAALTLACLLPFLDKAFHIDDPLFIWSTTHILVDPANPYDFNVNWYGRVSPMYVESQNPPLASYYMALVAAPFSRKEMVLHAWFLLPALALVLGTWRLARNLCAHPLAAALLTLAAPVFLISSTSVMCDTLMAAFWIWAVILWMEGLRRDSAMRLFGAALLISAAELTKYFGLALVPLLLAYSWRARRRAGLWMAWLAVPLAVLAAYEFGTAHLYGKGLFTYAATYSTGMQLGGNLATRLVVGLAFTGGCILALAPLAPLLWRRKALAGGLLAFVLTGLLVVALGSIGSFSVVEGGQVKWLFVIQFACAAVAGASAIALAAVDWLQRKTPDSLLLLLWVGGTLFFAAVLNWTVSGRNILPLLPAVSILAARRLDQRCPGPSIPGLIWAPLTFSLAVALAAARADYRLAECGRAAAVAIANRAWPDARHIWFEGHWGFQYYMQKHGAHPLDTNDFHFALHDIIVVPMNANARFNLVSDHIVHSFTVEEPLLPGVATMSGPCGAGFYTDGWGPMPFVFCRPPPEIYEVFKVQ